MPKYFPADNETVLAKISLKDFLLRRRPSFGSAKITKRLGFLLHLGNVCECCGLVGDFVFLVSRDHIQYKHKKFVYIKKVYYLVLVGNKNGEWIPMTLDHVIPLSKMGLSNKKRKKRNSKRVIPTPENAQILCLECNNLKANNPKDYRKVEEQNGP